MSPGKMIRILSGLRRKPGRGYPFLDLSPGDGGRESLVSCLLLLEAPAIHLAAKRLRRRRGRFGGRTGGPGRLPASVGNTCCPPGREAASAAGGPLQRQDGAPGQLPASIGSTCCPPGREATSAAGAFGAVSLRLPCVKGAGAHRATEGLFAETSPEALSPGNIPA